MSTGAIATATAAAVSWICCLPVLFGLAGATSGVFAATFGAWRPYLNVLSLLLLALAFYQLYFVEQPCRKQCSKRQLRFRNFLVWGALAIVSLAVTLPYWSSWLIYWLFV